MRTREIRIPMPMSLDEYHVALMWSFDEQSRRETGAGEGVSIVANEPFGNPEDDLDGLDGLSLGLPKEALGPNGLAVPGLRGQYTYKIYRVESKMPPLLRTVLRPLLGKSGFELHEESWNAFPYCYTVLTNPGYMKADFRLVFETVHVAGTDAPADNVLGWNQRDYDRIQDTVTLNVIADKCTIRDRSCDPRTFSSTKLCRGPLDPDLRWASSSSSSSSVPSMTVYKFVTAHFKWIGVQTKMEAFIVDQFTRMVLGLHQQMWCWADLWADLSLEDIRRLEEETGEQLERQINDNVKRGTSQLKD